jgi:hypothetical protein
MCALCDDFASGYWMVLIKLTEKKKILSTRERVQCVYRDSDKEKRVIAESCLFNLYIKLIKRGLCFEIQINILATSLLLFGCRNKRRKRILNTELILGTIYIVNKKKSGTTDY